MSLRFLGFSLDNGSPLARHPELRRAVALTFDRSQLGKARPQAAVQLAETLVPPALLNRPAHWHAFLPD
jgi:ABC-type oligopeptide transport system substrate-binding subunit